MRRQARNRRGFTLVELLVATVLIATGLTAGATAFSAAIRAQAAGARRVTESRLAEAKLAELTAMAVTADTGEGTCDEMSADASGTDLEDYRYRWEVAESDLTGLARGQVTVWYRDNERDAVTLVWYPLSP